MDGDEVAQGKVEATLSNIFSADDGLDVGEDSGAPVSPDYGPVGNHFNGEVKGVQLSIAEGETRARLLIRRTQCVQCSEGSNSNE